MVAPLALPLVRPELVPCTRCARCCTYVGVGINPPFTLRFASDVLWYLYHENVSVHLDGKGDWMVIFESRCRNLGDDLLCQVYERRPVVCREFDNTCCEVNAPLGGQTFTEPRQFLAWLARRRPGLHRRLPAVPGLAGPPAAGAAPPPAAQVRPGGRARARGGLLPRPAPERLSLHVLLLGGTGFMGYGLAWRLLLGGHRLTLFNRGLTADPFGPRVERLRGDRPEGGLPALLEGRRFDAVVDFTAYHGRDVAQVVEALGAGGVGHYVLISTGQVYLVREGCPAPAREEDYDGPLMAEPADAADRAEWEYGMGKRTAEEVLREAARAGFPGTALRLPVVNGEKDPTRRLESYLWRILDGGPVLLPDGGGQRLRHVYAGDVVRTIAALLGRADTFGRAFNLCQEEAPTLRELVGLLAELIGARPALLDVPAARLQAAGLTPRGVSPFSSRWISHLDPGRARAELGFAPTPLRQAMGSIVACWLSHLPEAPPPARYADRERERALA